jgi:hypothetical protein
MNVEKFLKQDVDEQIEKACQWGLRLRFLASDLRVFANAVNTKDINKLSNYSWFNHHFMGGSKAGEDYKTATNENYNSLGYCIRETQSNVLNTTEKKGNSGVDLITGRALLEMQKLGLGGLTTNEFHPKEGGFHCEHNFQVNHIKTLLLDRILGNNKIDPLSMIRFVLTHSLVVTVYNTERKDGGNNLNNNVAPFWRYANVGANVLQFTDDGFEDVTNCYIQEINSNRWNRNEYFKKFRVALENIDTDQLKVFHDKIYDSMYNKEPKSSTSPILNEANLKILTNNDPTEIATVFYPDKFKDRWKKKK